MLAHILPLLILNDINVTQGHFGQRGGQTCCHVKISIHQEASERRSGSREAVITESLDTPYTQENVCTCPLPSSRAWRSWEHSVSRKCPFLSPASALELHSLHPLVSPLPSLSLFHFLQLESVQMGKYIFCLTGLWDLWLGCCYNAYLSQGPAHFCHHALDVFLGAAVLSQDPQCSPVNPEKWQLQSKLFFFTKTVKEGQQVHEILRQIP